jgi:glucose/arabinose dehydrogenase
MRWLLVLGVLLAAAACDRPSDPTDDPGQEGAERITGRERLGWYQQAGGAAELAALRYLLYVDDAPTELVDVSCDQSARPVGFPCVAPLPALTPGAHTLELSTLSPDGPESPRSAPLRVFVLTQTLRPPRGSIETSDGVQLLVSVVTTGLVEPVDLAFAPEGRILIAERVGRIRVLLDNQRPLASSLPDVDARTGGGLLAIAVDPEFERTQWLYAVYTTVAGVQLARFRLTRRGLSERVILLDGLDATAQEPAASLRFGPDGKLYLALDDGGIESQAGDFGTFQGKVLRLNADATTPSDQAAATPVYALNVNAPRGLDWDRAVPLLWVLERDPDGQDRLQGIGDQGAGQRRGIPMVRYTLPPGTDASAVAMYRGDLIDGLRDSLLVAGRASRSVLRFRLDPSDRRAITATDRLVSDDFGQIRALGVAPDGSVYFCGDAALVRLSPETVGGTNR